MTNHPRVQVTQRPNPSEPGAVLLDFAEPCPYCGVQHHHGNPTPALDSDGTYGHRCPHCWWHTHDTRPDGRRARVTDRNLCREDHPGYLLVPVEGGQ